MNQSKETTAAAIEANLAVASSDLLVITSRSDEASARLASMAAAVVALD